VPEIVKVALILVSEVTVTLPTLTPPPFTVTVVPVCVKPDPVNVTGTGAPPRAAEIGLICVKVGAGGLTTVNGSVPLDPTPTCLVPGAVNTVIVNVAVNWVPAGFTCTLLTVIPEPKKPPPVTFTEPPLRPVPTKVTVKLSPR
jgi:hypothetical protein